MVLMVDGKNDQGSGADVTEGNGTFGPDLHVGVGDTDGSSHLLPPPPPSPIVHPPQQTHFGNNIGPVPDVGFHMGGLQNILQMNPRRRGRRPIKETNKLLKTTIIPSLIMSMIQFFPLYFTMGYFLTLQGLNELDLSLITSSSSTHYSEATKEALMVQLSQHPHQYEYIGQPGFLITSILTLLWGIWFTFECVVCGCLEANDYFIVKPYVLVSWIIGTILYILASLVHLIYMILAMTNLPQAHDHFIAVGFTIQDKKYHLGELLSEEGRTSYSYGVYYYGLVVNLSLGVIFIIIRSIQVVIVIKVRREIIGIRASNATEPRIETAEQQAL